MDRLPEDTVFALSAHLYSEQQDPSPRELIDNLERALRDVAALPHEASPAVAFARQALAEYRRLNAADRLTSITALVAYLLNVRLDDLMSRARNQHIAFCRQVAMYVCRRVSGASFPTLGEHFHRNHASVHHARLQTRP